LDVIIQGRTRKAVVADQPLYDPQSLLPRVDSGETIAVQHE
jgi:hypothetical protein